MSIANKAPPAVSTAFFPVFSRMKKLSLRDKVNDPVFQGWVYGLVALLASLGELAKGNHVVEGNVYTHHNNYLIFKQSFFHLIHRQDLYVLYLDEHWDLYKYSPTFAALMAVFAYLPDFLGLILWNGLNALTLFFAIRYLPLVSQRGKVLLGWFVMLEMLTSLQNAQSNAVIAGLIILAFGCFERRQVGWASLCLVLTVYIKLFGLVAFVLFLLYPGKVRFLAYSAGWVLGLLVVPLVFVSPQQLQLLYASWLRLLAADHSASLGLSVMGWLAVWFNSKVSNSLVVLAGALLFCLPLLRFGAYANFRFRLWLLASVLIWIVIFNHRAESPTFVIAICGVGLWYFTQDRKAENTALVGLAFVLTCLSPTDLFPAYLRTHWVNPFVLKAVPCIFVWFKLLADLLLDKYETPSLSTGSPWKVS